MLMFIWMCVMTSAFFPGGERLATLHTDTIQREVRASVERPVAKVMTLGWANEDEVPHL